jgi:hypothetical protein
MRPDLANLMKKKAKRAAALTGVAACAASFAPVAAAQAATTTGFKPAARPDSSTTCSGYICMSVFGHGFYVSSVQAEYISYPGCHIGELHWSSGSEVAKHCVYSGHPVTFPLDRSFPTGAKFSVSFHGVPGKVVGTIH